MTNNHVSAIAIVCGMALTVSLVCLQAPSDVPSSTLSQPKGYPCQTPVLSKTILTGRPQIAWHFAALRPFPTQESEQPNTLWSTSSELPPAADIPRLDDVQFSVIKPYEPQRDGYRFLHGVALVFHQDRLFASFAHNKGDENTGSEEARYTVSSDGGKTWSELKSIDGGNDDLAVSHGVFLSHQNDLWAFQGAFTGNREDVHTRAYRWDDKSESWAPQGRVCGEGFWPMQEPLLMQNGDWIMAGLRVGQGNPPAVAISEGDNLKSWKVIPITPGVSDAIWGESTVIVNGKEILNISRYGAQARALLAKSQDYGRTWTPTQPSNLPMTTSKPYAGTLSTGENYLIATTTADSGTRRSPLTIALSRPGETTLSRVFVVRPAEFPQGPGESHPGVALAYPYAVEHAGKLYVGYSNNGANIGRTGGPLQRANNNSAELAIIPLDQLHRDE